MTGATLAVVLVEMLAARPGPTRSVLGMRTGGGGRWTALAVTTVLLAASMFALFAEYIREDERWVKGRPWSYTGPVSLIEQRFRSNHDNLSRISVWANVDSGSSAAPAEVFARLTSATGLSPGPLRESRAEVRGARYSNAIVDFDFEPIPDSSGKAYILTVGVLSGPEPYVFLGLSGSDVNPEGEAVISGAPTSHGDDLALRTYWAAQDGRLHPSLSFTSDGQLRQTERGLYFLTESHRYWLLVADATLTSFLWLFLIMAAWSGLSDGKSRFWRGYVWPSVRRSALITASLAAFVLVMLPLFAGSPHT